MGKKSGSGSGMNNRIIFLRASELKKNFLVKLFKFFDVVPGSGMEKFGSGIRDPGWKRSDPGSGIREKHRGSTTLLKSSHSNVPFRPMRILIETKRIRLPLSTKLEKA
jgi:hypothetical protein